MMPRCEILARLTLDARAPKQSGFRLIEWARTCAASGVVIPRGIDAALAQQLSREASTAGLSCDVEGSAQSDARLSSMYTDDSPDFIHTLRAAQAGATIILKGLTLNRSLGGPEHQGSLYPDEFARLVELVRFNEAFIEAFLAGRRDRPEVPVRQENLAFTETLVASRPLRMGQVVSAEDVMTVRDLRGISAARLSEVVGQRLLFDRQPDEPITFGVLEPWKPRRRATPLSDVSVIIRVKNEAGWLRRSLPAILHQSRPPRDIVVVDNESTDETVGIAEEFGCKVLSISSEEFSFGRALNHGISAATGAWIVSLSAHCIPVHDHWLEALLAPDCEHPFAAAVYGRQEPLPDTNDFDKRDLWTTFGAERRVQRGRDYFFHNANSLIRRSVWERIPFDETLNGVEDRAWAKRALADGYQIIYAPLASVHHYHGIHQGRNVERARRVVKVIEFIQKSNRAVEQLNLK